GDHYRSAPRPRRRLRAQERGRRKYHRSRNLFRRTGRAASVPTTMLSVDDIHTYYDESHVLQGVTLHVDEGTVAAVLGRNGMGKTTLCRSISGVTPARAGRIVFNGSEITHAAPHRIFEWRVSLVPQGRRI